MINHFGLDIGSDSLKIAQVTKEGNLFRLLTAGIAKTPTLSLAMDSEKDLVALAEAIKKLKSEIKVVGDQVVVALPERAIFTNIIEVPKMNEDELGQAIFWEAENVIPQPLSEVNLDWEVIGNEESVKTDKMKVFLVAAPKVLVEKYLRVLKLADLEPLALETELLAAVRSLKPIFGKGNLVLVNLGVKAMDIVLIDSGQLFLSRSLPTAGEALTRAVAAALGFDLATAEEYKKTYGLSAKAESKVALAIEPIVKIMANEIKKAVSFYEEKSREPLKLLVMFGGSSLLPGLAEYLTQLLSLEVQVADPLSAIKMEEKDRQLLRKDSPFLTIALGLAMKEK